MNTRMFTSPIVVLLMLPFPLAAAGQSLAGSDPHPEVHLYDVTDFGIEPVDVTFSKDIAPILQRSCQSCHRPDGGARRQPSGAMSGMC